MKKFILLGVAVLSGTAAFSQSAIDAYRLSQPDLKGTARFMGMGGAFTALGGDLSTISQNPAGIGVYRQSEVGFTLDLDCQHSDATDGINTPSDINQTKFLLNNIGFVWTMRLPSSSCPNLNFGFTYNKSVSFNRKYGGRIDLNDGTQSLSNYIANLSNMQHYTEGMLIGEYYESNSEKPTPYDPYNPPAGLKEADWLSILGYQSYLTSLSPTADDSNYFVGQWQNGETSGYGNFDVTERGSVDSYNIAFGGNIANVVFWGMDFDITNLNYTLTPHWTEDLTNARVEGDEGSLINVPANWTLSNYYNCSGTGFNYKLGIIVKPVQELRLGFAFHTPTWYGLTETFNADLGYLYDNNDYGVKSTNDGYMGYNDVNFRTPWKITAGAAAVLFNSLIISVDYEWQKYDGMKYSAPSYGGDYWGDQWFYPWEYPDFPYYQKGDVKKYISYPYEDSFYDVNQNIKSVYRSTNTLRIGAEYRVIPQMSVRLGYCNVSSPVRAEMNQQYRGIYTSNGTEYFYPSVETAGTIPNYRFDNTTNYITCGLGFRIKSFYIDAAYVYKHISSEFHAYTSWNNDYGYGNSPVAKVNLDNSQIVLSAGFKF